MKRKKKKIVKNCLDNYLNGKLKIKNQMKTLSILKKYNKKTVAFSRKYQKNNIIFSRLKLQKSKYFIKNIIMIYFYKIYVILSIRKKTREDNFQ